MTGIEARIILKIKKDIRISKSDLKIIYRRLALANHPDKFRDPIAKLVATEKFKEINEANEVLKQLLPDNILTGDAPLREAAPTKEKGNDSYVFVREYIAEYLSDYINRKLEHLNSYKYGKPIVIPLKALCFIVALNFVPAALIWIVTSLFAIILGIIFERIVGAVTKTDYKGFYSVPFIRIFLMSLLSYTFIADIQYVMWYVYLIPVFPVVEVVGLLLYFFNREQIIKLRISCD